MKPVSKRIYIITMGAWLFCLTGPAATNSSVPDDWQSLVLQSWKVSQQGNTNPEDRKRAQDSARVLGLKALELAHHQFGKNSPAAGVILNRLGDFKYILGNFTAAESLWTKALQINESADLSDPREREGSLFRLGVYFVTTGRHKVEIQPFKRAVSFCDSVLSTLSPEVVDQLRNFMDVYDRLELFDEAEAINVRILHVWEKNPLSDPRWAIISLVRQGEDISKPSHTNVGASFDKQDSAIALGVRALEIAETKLSKKDTLVAYVANRLGDYYDRKGDFGRTASLWEQAWEINRVAFPAKHIEAQGSIFRMAGIYKATGRYAEAEILYRQAVELREQTQGPGHPETAAMYMSLANLYHKVGKFDQAEKNYRKGLKIRQLAVQQIDSDLAQSLRYLGRLYFDQGRYAAAEEYLGRALEIRKNSLGEAHAYTAYCLSDLAQLYMTWGRLNEAEEMLSRALNAMEQFLGPNHPGLAGGLQDMATLYRTEERFDEARALLTRALDIWADLSGWENLEYASCLSEMAYICKAEGDLSEAMRLLEDVLKLKENLLGAVDYRLVATLSDLGDVLEERRQCDEAEKMYQRIRDIRKRTSVKDHPDFATAYEGYARLALLTGRSNFALELSRVALDIRQINFRDGVAVMAERDALRYARLLKDSRDKYISAFFQCTNIDEDKMEQVSNILFRTKGPVSDEIIRRNLAPRSDTDELVASLTDSLHYARAQLSRLYTEGPGSEGLAEYRQSVRASSEKKRHLESSLARMSTEYRGAVDVHAASAAAIASALPENAVLIEYTKFRINNPSSDCLEDRYLAICLTRKDGVVRIEDLGPAVIIDSCVGEYRDHMYGIANRSVPPTAADKAEYRPISDGLYRLLLKPFADVLAHSEGLFIAPDGELNVVSFASIQVPKGDFLVEDHSIHYLSAGRDLVRKWQDDKQRTGLLALGDPDFDASPEARVYMGAIPAPKETRAASWRLRNVRSACENLWKLKAERIPGTRSEVSDIVSTWKQITGEPAWLFLGAGASENVLKQKAGDVRVIHFATHGFYAGNDCTVSDTFPVLTVGQTAIGENPMLQSGLLLAGANLKGAQAGEYGLDDGVLTAEEVCNLNLAGITWVVLSACESGLGEVQSGEGVYGLRRAFLQAGARTVISSLWEIPDHSTSQFMKTLYGMSAGNLPEALRLTALESLKNLRRRGQPDHPYNWAAFIAIGDWRGIH